MAGNTAHLCFDPDAHPTDTLKSFLEFCRIYELRYDAQFPDPPKTSLDAAIQRWVVANATEENTNPRPTLDQYDEIRETWRSKDKVAKLIGMFSTPRLSSDWEAAEESERNRKKALWTEFKQAMCQYYAPTENSTLMNYKFRGLSQNSEETFPAFCNRVEKEARLCQFKCDHVDCSAEVTAVRDQIIIGTNNVKIREEALLRSWKLKELRREGTKMESAARGELEISGNVAVNKVRPYSYANIKQSTQKDRECFNCGDYIKGPFFKHKNES